MYQKGGFVLIKKLSFDVELLTSIPEMSEVKN